MTTRIVFECDGYEHPIAITEEFAPRTVAALRDWLPTEITLHSAKIAGCHIYWPTPILVPLEKGANIHSLPAGSFLYYPDRQYLEITYDALQAETAAVNMLGTFEGDLAWLREFAERQRREHGQKVFTARLRFEGQSGADSSSIDASDDSPLGRLKQGRMKAWADEPEELKALLKRDGLNIPFGPMITAEGEFRRTQELLWRLWHNSNGHDDSVRVVIAREVLDLTLARIVGYCQLEEAGQTLQAGKDALSEPNASVGDILGELTIYCGRMGAWIDLHIPWWEANEVTRRNLARSPSVPA